MIKGEIKANIALIKPSFFVSLRSLCEWTSQSGVTCVPCPICQSAPQEAIQLCFLMLLLITLYLSVVSVRLKLILFNQLGPSIASLAWGVWR